MDKSMMFDRSQYANVFKPVEAAETLPPWCYTSEEFFQEEVKNLFMNTWNFFGHVDQVKKPGDYITVEFVGVPIIIVRGRDDVIRAFANNCRHRGAPVAKGEGNSLLFTCPYHSWSYDLTGQLRGCPGMEKTENFEKNDHGLIPLRLEVHACFMFINFNNQAESLSEFLGDFPEIMGSYKLENMRLTRKVVHEIDCNWKSHFENAMEEYHLTTVHKQTLDPKQMEHSALPTSGNWFDIREHHDDNTRALLPEDLEHALPQIPGLEGRAEKGTNYVALNPSTMLGMTLDCVWYLQLMPTGPNHTTLILGSCFPSETVELPDFEKKAEYYYKRWDTTLAEDNEIAAVQHLGLRSPMAVAGRMSHLEPLVPALGQWWIDRILPENNAV
jgi:phenylpropionate dioxygenase-like ring-hydroxylating dioxygenase large terminal subunit